MAHWRKLLPEFIHDIRYEDLADNPEQEMRGLLEFCGLEWEEACLNFTNYSVLSKPPAKVKLISPWTHRQKGDGKNMRNTRILFGKPSGKATLLPDEESNASRGGQAGRISFSRQYSFCT